MGKDGLCGEQLTPRSLHLHTTWRVTGQEESLPLSEVSPSSQPDASSAEEKDFLPQCSNSSSFSLQEKEGKGVCNVGLEYTDVFSEAVDLNYSCH